MIRDIKYLVGQADLAIATIMSDRKQIRSLIAAKDELWSKTDEPRLFKEGAKELERYVQIYIHDRKLDQSPRGVHRALMALSSDLEIQLERRIEEKSKEVESRIKKLGDEFAIKSHIDSVAALLDVDPKVLGGGARSDELLQAARAFEARMDDVRNFLSESLVDPSMLWERKLQIHLSTVSSHFEAFWKRFVDARQKFTLRFKGRGKEDVRAAYESVQYPDPLQLRLPDLRTTVGGRAMLVVGRHLDATQSVTHSSESEQASSGRVDSDTEARSFQELAAQERDLLVGELLSQYPLSKVLDQTLALLANEDATESANAESLRATITGIHDRMIVEADRIVEVHSLPKTVAIKAVCSRKLTGELPTWLKLLEGYPAIAGIFGRVAEKYPEILSQSEELLSKYLGALGHYRTRLCSLSSLLTEELDYFAVPLPTVDGIHDSLTRDLDTVAKTDVMKRREAEVLVALTIRDLISAGVPEGIDPTVVQLAAEVLVGGFYHLGKPVPETMRGRLSGDIQKEVKRCLHVCRDTSLVHDAIVTVLEGPYVVCSRKDSENPAKNLYHPRIDPDGLAQVLLERISDYYGRWSKRASKEPSQRRRDLPVETADPRALIVSEVRELQEVLIGARQELVDLIPELQTVSDSIAEYAQCLAQIPSIVSMHKDAMSKPDHLLFTPHYLFGFSKDAVSALYREQNRRALSAPAATFHQSVRGRRSKALSGSRAKTKVMTESEVVEKVRQTALSYKPEFPEALAKSKNLLRICADLSLYSGSESASTKIPELERLSEQLLGLSIPHSTESENERVERTAALAKQLMTPDGGEPELVRCISACISAMSTWLDRDAKEGGLGRTCEGGIIEDVGDQSTP